MKVPAPVEQTASSLRNGAARQSKHRHLWLKWGVVIASGLTIASIPAPPGLTAQSWRLLAIFLATIAGCIVQPLPGAAIVLLGVSAAALFGALPVAEALGGYADPSVWMVLAAFFMSRGVQHAGEQFQPVTWSSGGSMQHGCNMKARSSASASRLTS